MPISEKELGQMNLSFAGCGFLCIYHAGVCAAIKEYAPQLASNKVSGASAGAIAAAGLICNVCMSKATSTILAVVAQARAGCLRALSPNFNLMKMLRSGLEDALPPDAHLLCSGRLFISMTRARDYKNVTVSEFATREELIQAIMCSSFIPFYCGRYPPTYRGEAYLDGGFSDNQPAIDANTVTVSPFSGESDICPIDGDSASFMGFSFCGTSVQFTTQNMFRMMVILFPPSQEICSRICRQGFEDTLQFLTKNGISPCAHCLTIQSSAIPLSQATSTRTRLKSQSFPPLQLAGSKRKFDECERCLASRDPRVRPVFSQIPLPPQVQAQLDNAAAAESRLFKYLRSFRLYRWTVRCMTPVILPFELFIYSLRTLQAWTRSFTTSESYFERLQRTVDFVLAEVDAKRLLGCEPSSASSSHKVAITEIDGLSAPTTRYFEAGAEAETEPLPISPTEPSPEEGEPSSMAAATTNAEQLLVDYTQNHEAVLAFQYTDEGTNEVQVCEIYDMAAHPKRSARACQCTSEPREGEEPAPIYNINASEGEERKASYAEADHKEALKFSRRYKCAEDSGLSLGEDATAASSSPNAKRDACCSPIQVPTSPPMSQKRESPGPTGIGTRRHTVGGSSKRGLAQQKMTVNGSISSLRPRASKLLAKPTATEEEEEEEESEDADAGEQFFVCVNRRSSRKGKWPNGGGAGFTGKGEAYDGGGEEASDEMGR